MSKTEQTLIKIWKEVLGIHIDNNQLDFFSAGGNSIQALQIITLIEEKLQISLAINDFFDATSIAELTSLIDSRC